jgi:hypothetical protein
VDLIHGKRGESQENAVDLRGGAACATAKSCRCSYFFEMNLIKVLSLMVVSNPKLTSLVGGDKTRRTKYEITKQHGSSRSWR